MSKPYFSIIIPCLNEANFLPELLQDLVNQSWTDFEVIVVDGKSEDETVALAQPFCQKIALKILTSSRRKVSLQRNLGNRAATGNWRIFMDADNRLPSHFLMGLRYQLDRNPDTDIFTNLMDTSAYDSADESAIATMYNAGLQAYAVLRKPTAVGALIGATPTLLNKINFRSFKDPFDDHDFVTRAFHMGFNYKIFRDPTYTYSMRRFRKEGTLKMVTTFAQINFNALIGLSNSKLMEKYTMKGGGQYDEISDRGIQFFTRLSKLLKSLPKSELQRLRSNLQKLWS